MNTQPAIVRIERNSIPEPNTGCWLWLGTTINNKRPIMEIAGKRRLAHRVALETRIGAIPEGLNACHHCNNAMCVNPEHLYAGTQQQNIDDMMRAGRHHFQTNPEALEALRDQMRALSQEKLLSETCANGHARTPENTRWSAGRRHCLACQRKTSLEYYYRKRSVA